MLAGSNTSIIRSRIGVGNYTVLANAYCGPFGTLLISSNTLEEAKLCGVILHQSISKAEAANIAVVGNEFSEVTAGKSRA